MAAEKKKNKTEDAQSEVWNAIAAFEQIRDDVCYPNLNVKFLVGEKIDKEFVKSAGLFPNLERVENFEQCFEEYGPKFLKTV